MSHFLVSFFEMSSASLSPSLDLCFLESRLLSPVVGYPQCLGTSGPYLCVPSMCGTVVDHEEQVLGCLLFVAHIRLCGLIVGLLKA